MRIFTVTAGLDRMFLCTSLLLAVLLMGVPVSAHVEKGAMPDSVAEMEYRILLEFTPKDVATRSLLGMALLRQGKLAEAEKEFRIILQSDPKNFDALDSLGVILFKQKRFNEALSHLLTALKIRPEDIMVYLHIGQVQDVVGQTEQARETLATGVNLLGKGKPSSTKDQQLAEFKAALAKLPKKNGTVSLQ